MASTFPADLSHDQYWPTPININRMNDLLSGYDQQKHLYIIKGLQNRFNPQRDIHLTSQAQVTSVPKNHASVLRHPDTVKKKLLDEVTAERLAGPFPTKASKDLHVSPVTLSKKHEKGKYRIIHDLCAPKGNSLNDTIPEENGKVEYATLDSAVRIIQSMHNTAYLVKSDIEDAYKLVPVASTDHHFLGICWNTEFFYDHTLRMGCRTSCKIFEELSTVLQWILENKFHIKGVGHILDNFLMIANLQSGWSKYRKLFRSCCNELGIPLVSYKTIGPLTCLTFLGIIVDTIAMENWTNVYNSSGQCWEERLPLSNSFKIS